MTHARPGVGEQFLAGQVEGAFARGGCTAAYSTILSVRGEVLHNHDHRNTLQAGDIVLLDAGAEGLDSGYCNDVTRDWPVGGAFSPEGRDVYDLVLAAELDAISAVKPGVRYRDLHLRAARLMADGLVRLGLLKGDAAGLVESGAHALFFPHGLGHQLGLDVHDLETFGDRIHYPNGRTRSPQFGTQYLRMDLDLAPGMVFTIEPGLYFVPAILNDPKFREQFKTQVNWALAEKFLALNGGRGFGGIRIEDDVVCTPTGFEVLTDSIPKARAEVEALAGSA
jgi:Xaa-Pro aminopeptidase